MKSAYIAGVFDALEFGVARVKKILEGMTPEQLNTVPPGLKNSIAALVLHTYGVEANFAHRLAGKPTPDDMKIQYLLDQPQNPLPQPQGETAESLTAKIEQARALLQESFSQLAEEDLNADWEAPNGRKVPYKYLVSLLPQHQGQHYGHIQYIKQLIGA